MIAKEGAAININMEIAIKCPKSTPINKKKQNNSKDAIAIKKQYNATLLNKHVDRKLLLRINKLHDHCTDSA